MTEISPGNLTKVPASVVPISSSTVLPSLAPEIRITNKTSNFSASAENGPEISW